MEVDDDWTAQTPPSELHLILERFFDLQGVTIPGDAPMARWLKVLDDAGHAKDARTQFVTSFGGEDQRRTHDLIEAQRLAWSLAVLYTQGRRPPELDGSFVTKQLLGCDDAAEPDINWRMPTGTFLLNYAARLQQAEDGRIRICGIGARASI